MGLVYSDVDLSEDLEVRCSLLEVGGMGYMSASYICDTLGLPLGIKLGDVDMFLFIILSSLTETNYLMGEDLRRVKGKNIRGIEMSHSYKGISHSSALPVSGQRTHSNASTRKQFFVK